MVDRESKPSIPADQSSKSTDPSHTDSELQSIIRPSIYSHEPRPRAAPLEEYYGVEPRNIHILSELKSDRLEGLYNLSFFVLAFCLLYLFLRSVREEGFFSGPAIICTRQFIRDAKLSLLLMLPLPPVLLSSYALIVLRSKGMLQNQHVPFTIHIISVVIFAMVAMVSVFRANLHPIFGVLHGLLNVIVMLKQHSYVLTNILLGEEAAGRRAGTKEVENNREATAAQPDVHKNASEQAFYPRNVTLSNFCYFIAAPTLVYETIYPRTSVIRKRYVTWYSFQVLVCLAIEYILMRQFTIPILLAGAKTDKPLWSAMRLALPSFLSWLVMFWMIFHCTLSIIAELTRFADRQFYREWWNATTIQQFWRLWNTPVHEWCVRHLYAEPVMLHNVSPEAAAFGTFLMSALLHEYVCSMAFGMVKPYMFFGMLVQIPLIKISNGWRGQRIGNLFMWVMLFVGQSACALMYVRDYVRSKGDLPCMG